LIFYVRHASRHPNPILDLLLFRIPTFAIAVGGGSLFRIGIGALPFLLPLLLQLGFGMTAFASGMLTFASAVGALAMKITARPILRRWGFRKVMIANALISGGFLLSYAAFRPGIPSSVILVLLLAGGFFRSLVFTSLNALSYADIDPPRMSRATSLASVSQQTSGAVGVALAAICVETIQLGFGDSELQARDLSLAFVLVAIVSSLSVLVFAHLKPDAGAAVSGKRAPRAHAQPAAAE
jgi:MFS family permease